MKNNINSIRKDWRLIESLINPNSKILDVGCGEGSLIEQLEKNIYAKTHGIEINPELAQKAIALYDGGDGDEASGLLDYDRFLHLREIASAGMFENLEDFM